MQRVFVVDAAKRPLMPCRPARARLLLTRKRAAVFRMQPFTIILHESRPEVVVQPLRLKIDPGSVTTGLALLHTTSGEVMWAGELTHQGQAVRNSATKLLSTNTATTNGMHATKRSVSMTTDRSIEEPCEVTNLTHGFGAERRGRPLRLGSDQFF
jgi:RRXRR protein